MHRVIDLRRKGLVGLDSKFDIGCFERDHCIVKVVLFEKSHLVEGPVGAQGQVAQYTVTVPETETSQIMTRVSVPDNGTLLLGGQKITAEIDKEAGIPILSKIPLLGRLFSNRSKIRDNKILLILVKPTIILQEEKEAEAIAAMEGEF